MAEKKQRKKKPTLKDQISELNSQVSDEKDKILRLFAEFENYRKRTAKERLELFKTASQELMTALLPIADDMDRAINELRKSKDAENLKGFELIYSKIMQNFWGLQRPMRCLTCAMPKQSARKFICWKKTLGYNISPSIWDASNVR